MSQDPTAWGGAEGSSKTAIQKFRHNLRIKVDQTGVPINTYIDCPDEQTVGTAVNLTHGAATPPGLTVTVKVKLENVEGRKLTFSILADDGIDKISEGTHERFIISASKFNEKMKAKALKGTP